MRVYLLILIFLTPLLIFKWMDSNQLPNSEPDTSNKKEAILKTNIAPPSMINFDRRKPSLPKKNNSIALNAEAHKIKEPVDYNQKVIQRNYQAITFGPEPVDDIRDDENSENFDSSYYVNNDQSITFGPVPDIMILTDENMGALDQSFYIDSSITFGPVPDDSVVPDAD